MREIRTYGSEGGETGQPVFPTPIESLLAAGRDLGPARQTGPTNSAKYLPPERKAAK